MPLTVQDCKKILHEYGKVDSVITSFQIHPFSSDILGFLGEHYRLEIVYQDDNNIYKKKQFFLKMLPSFSKEHQHYLISGGYFKKEVLVYNLLTEFEDLFDIPIAPKKYLTKIDDVIVLEDLRSTGYDCYNGEANLEFCISVMRTLAAFHASSIVFEEKRKVSGRSYYINEHFDEEMKEVGFIFDEAKIRSKFVQAAVKSIAECINLMPDFIDAKEIIKKLYTFLNKYASEFVKPSKEFRNVVTHSDVWRNNIMVRRNSKNELESILVDFQFARYVPGAYDISMFLYLNATKDFLEENLQYILDFYYKIFCRYLKTYNLVPDDILTEREFHESINSYRLIAVLDAAMTATMAFIDKDLSKRMFTIEGFFEEFGHLNRSKYIRQQFQENTKFRKPFTDVLHQLATCIREAKYL